MEAKQKTSKKLNPEISINRAIQDSISPRYIKFNTMDTVWGENYVRAVSIINYPSRAGTAWLARVAKLDGVVLSIHASPTDAGALVDSLNKSISEWGTRIAAGGDALLMQRNRQAYEDASTLLQRVDQEQENVMQSTVTMLIFASDEEELERRYKRVKGAIGGQRMMSSILANEQEQGIIHTGPYGIIDKGIHDRAVRLIPSTTLAASMPFASSGINDGKGIRLGRDADNGIILVDQFDRDTNSDRTNANWTILGVPGTGKSAAAKHIIVQEWSQGTTIIALDAQHEYVQMCSVLRGQVVDVGGGAKINPLQVKIYTNEEARSSTTSYSLLSQHMLFLKTFYHLCLKDLDDTDMAYLETVLEAVYAQKGIYYDTNITNIKNNEWPINSDVHTELQKRSENSNTEDEKKIYTRLTYLFRSMSIGANSSLWNGYTDVELNNEFIVFDTFQLNKADVSTRRAQYYNVLMSCWELIQANRNSGQNLMLFADEAYTMVDPAVPQTMQDLRDISKQIRKFGGGLCVISHTPNDFLDPEIRRDGEALLQNSCYKLLMGTDGKALEEEEALYKLTEGERELIASKQRGRGLFIAGSKRSEITIELTDKELEIFGSGGGK